MAARPVRQPCCITQATLFNVCLADDDLRRLGSWVMCPNRFGFSSAVLSRASLHKACQRDVLLARRVTDLLDVQYIDSVVTVRSLKQSELEESVAGWIQKPNGRALPGLLWALCSDARSEIHAIGVLLCHEAVAIACRHLVADSATTPKERDP